MKKVQIIPEPIKSQIKEGSFKLDTTTSIHSDNLFESNLNILRELLKSEINLDLKQILNSEKKSDNNYIALISVNERSKFPPEGYKIEINTNFITIKASTGQGCFYGIQTLKQLLISNKSSNQLKNDSTILLPCIEIEDYPRFKWRGFMLDESRHFFGKGVVKKILDIMGFLKLNKFHWHLTDDQGWRIEIKKYPKLIEIGSKRKGEKLWSSRIKAERVRDKKQYSGFYTQAEIKEVIEYAKKYYIDIIPEIDIPGHTTSIIAAYPELSCTRGPFEVRNFFGILEDVLCAGNEEVYHFLENLFDEIIELFPSKFIHIGGDEVPKTRWNDCAKCQAKIKEENLENVKNLQTYFTNRIAEYILSRGKIPIGWNEILNKNLISDAICQYWTPNLRILLKNIKMGRKVIMSETGKIYLNYGYKVSPLQGVYEYNVIPKTLEVQYYSQFLGIEACLWTEFISTSERFEYLTFPRLIALAENSWTLNKNKNYDKFMEKLPTFLKKHFTDINLPKVEEYSIKLEKKKLN